VQGHGGVRVPPLRGERVRGGDHVKVLRGLKEGRECFSLSFSFVVFPLLPTPFSCFRQHFFSPSYVNSVSLFPLFSFAYLEQKLS